MRTADDRGVALMSVLWGVALLSLIAAAVVTTARSVSRNERVLALHAQAEAAAEGGINHAILALLDPRARGWRLDGTPRTLRVGERTVTVAIQDEFGRIDVNLAGTDQLQRLLRSVGVSERQAVVLADRVLDWRDPTPTRRLGGAKAEDYRAAGLSYGPRNGPFHSVDEVALVLGMPPELFALLRPALSVYAQIPIVRKQTAPLEALRALPGEDEATIARHLAERARDDDLAADAGTVVSRAFTITAEVVTAEARTRRVQVVRFTEDPARPVLVLGSW